MVSLLNILIEEIRIENDSVDKDQLLFNQGKLSAYKSIISYILSGTGVKNA
jgi:hypothetical protein